MTVTRGQITRSVTGYPAHVRDGYPVHPPTNSTWSIDDRELVVGVAHPEAGVRTGGSRHGVVRRLYLIKHLCLTLNKLTCTYFLGTQFLC